MIALWMLYAVLVAALLSGAAAASEWAVRAYDRPSRAVWLAALGGSIAAPLAAFLLPDLVSGRLLPGSGGISGSWALSVVEGGAGPVAAASRPWPEVAGALARLDPALLAFWAASILGLLGFLGLSWYRLRRERASWEPRTVSGVRVLVSGDRGPAVLGLLRPRIVLPRWALGLEEDLCLLALLHEREHVRAGDHRAFALGLLAVTLLPWNPALWWQLRRLRLAIERDCDRRVLDGGASPARYGELLLRAGRRGPGIAFGAAALAEPTSFLERRVRAMTRDRVRNRALKALLAGVAAVGLLAAACETPIPPDEEESGLARTADAEVPSQAPDARPTFIPYDEPPRLRNPEAVRQALEERYPAELRKAGIGGSVVLWLYIDEEGAVRETVVKSGAEESRLDAAARAVAEEMSFTPARNRDLPTAVWVQQQITFRPAEAGTRSSRDAEAPSEAGTEEGEKSFQAIMEENPSGVRLGEEEDGSDTRPLVVVDGVIQSSPDLDRLNDLEIEKVEILKGEAARGPYGDRARGGVIRITTKAGAGG